MPNTVHLPLVGNVPKGAAIAGAGAAVVVTGYLIYRNKKASTIDTAYGYGGAAAASGYGYGYGSYYAYGSEYGYGGYGTGAGGGGYTPYPVGAEYGYGAYGYGYYNPYTGQWIGPTQQQPPTKPPPKPTPHKKGKWVTVAGRREYYNPNKQTLGYYVGKGKKRHWVKTKI